MRLAPAALLAALAACASAPPAPVPATADSLARALARAPVVLLGEVHDNAAQHALRLQALERLLAAGVRPALAFEQLDADRQALLDNARATFVPLSAADARVERLVAAAGARGWNWAYYRPYLALALRYDLPIVAANLSRARAMRVALDGVAAVFDAGERAALGLDAVAPDLLQAQRAAIVQGHCGRLSDAEAAPLALAQVARDAVLAQSIAPYADRGVVLLTGNGHARKDIGVARHLAAKDRARTVTIGLLEDDAEAAAAAPQFDVVLLTPAQARPDPCATMPPIPLPARG